MPVAKSYANCPIIKGPYMKNKREYVVVATKNNPNKEVRWYSEEEYCKMYGLPFDYGFNPKKAFGFDKGYIHIFTNDDKNEEFFSQSCARYSTFFGWYIVSNDDVPNNLPDGVRAIKIYWEDISKDDNILPYDQIKALCDYFKMEDK